MILNEMTSEGMQQRVSELIASRTDIEALYYIIERERLLEWAHSVGIGADSQLRDLVPAVPPLDLRRMAAAPSEPVFLWTGLKDAEMCVSYMDRHLQSASEEFATVLDFGCGCGRTSRFLQAMKRLNVHGSDVNENLVRWCQQNLGKVETVLNQVDPELPFEEGKFDFIYSLSIFSHLSEQSMERWLAELARVAADNGIVLLTTHGFPAIRTISQSQQHRDMFRMTSDVAENLLANFHGLQFVHYPYDAAVMDFAKAGSDYGNAFIHEDYIRSRWTQSEFEVIEFVEGGLRGWQDVTILRRRARASSVVGTASTDRTTEARR